MKKLKLTISCPHCYSKSLAYCQDAIIPYSLKQFKNGKNKVSKMMKDKINFLENAWIECGKCHATSDTSNSLNGTKELRALFSLIDS